MKMPQVWWDYVEKHNANIEDCIRQWGGTFRLEQYQTARSNQDVRRMMSILNQVWFDAPDERAVYSVPGFTELCNLLDGSIAEPLAD